MATTRAARRRAEEEGNGEEFADFHSENGSELSVPVGGISSLTSQQAALTFKYKELAATLTREYRWEKQPAHTSQAEWLLSVEHLLAAQIFILPQEMTTQTVYTQLFLNAVPPRIGMLLRTDSGSFVTWEEAKEIFLRDQMGVGYAAMLYQQYSAMKQGANEGIVAFYHRFEQTYDRVVRYCGSAIIGQKHLGVFTPKLYGKVYPHVGKFFQKRNYDFSASTPEQMYQELRQYLLSRIGEVDSHISLEGRSQGPNEQVNLMRYSNLGNRNNQYGYNQGNRNGFKGKGKWKGKSHYQNKNNNNKHDDNEEEYHQKKKGNNHRFNNIEDQENDEGTSAMSQ
eukprot:jgi/Picre1/33553/NNA_008875.t1